MSSIKRKNILIIYSNPADTTRVRLDKEHRAIEQVLQHIDSANYFIKRLHATTIEDFIHAVNEKEYEIIQFSGHGSKDGIILENFCLDAGIILSPKQICSILQKTSPNIKAAIFISCFSSSSINELIDSAPYLITVSGLADDDASIEFIKSFYKEYFEKGSIENAFNYAQLIIEAWGLNLNTILSRRAREKQGGRVFYQVFPGQKDDSLLIDITEAEKDIKKLGISRDHFLYLLSKKIRIHRWIFNLAREKAILPIGPYFGQFTWKDSQDIVICHKIMKIKPDIDELTCGVWATLVFMHNENYLQSYRSVNNPSDHSNKFNLKTAIDRYRRFFDRFFLEERNADIFNSKLHEYFKITKSIINANLDICDQKYYQEDYSSTIAYLEVILSAFHDFVDALTLALTE